MDTFGVTPVEAAHEIIGLTHCKLLMDFYFKNTSLGLAVFVAAFFTALWLSVQKGNFRELIQFVFLFFFLWFIFIVPSSKTPNAASTMENQGYTGLSAQDIVLTESAGPEVSLILTSISKFFNAVIIGAVKAISVATINSEYNYLKNPFFINKVCLQMQRFAGEGIQDKELKAKVADFYYTHYLPAISLMSKGSDDKEEIGSWWPGHGDVIRHYSSQGQEEWQTLKSQLLDYIHANSLWEIMKTFVLYFSADGSDAMSLEDRMIISLFDAETRKSAGRMASQDAYGPAFGQQVRQTIFSDIFGEGLALAAASVWQIVATATCAAALKSFPYIEGYACIIMYSLFPVTLLLCLIFRKASILFKYFHYLFWIKSWVLVWAIIHYASLFMADLQAIISPGTAWFWERPYFNVVTCVFILMAPAIAYYFVEGFLQGIGNIATAVTLHIDKAIGKVDPV